MSHRVSIMVGVLGLGLLGASPASALEWVAGRFGAAPAFQATVDKVDAAADPLVFQFTPRAAGALYFGTLGGDGRSSGTGAEDVGTPFRLGRLGLDSAAVTTTGQQEGMLIGGAFRYEDLALTGAVGRSWMLGREADLFAAGVRYGAVGASVGFAHARQAEADRVNGLFLFSTQYAALPWLSLESDLAFGESEADEGLAVGRLGIRLNF